MPKSYKLGRLSAEHLGLYEFPLDQPIPEVRPGEPVEIRVAENIAQLPDSFHRLQPGELAAVRLKEGKQVILAVKGDAVLAYCWVGFDETAMDEIDASVLPRRDEIYLYDAFTVPEARGKKLYQVLLAAALRRAAAEGRRRALIFVAARNVFSVRAVRSVGFEKFESIFYACLPSIRIYILKMHLHRTVHLRPTGAVPIAGGLDRPYALLAARESWLARPFARSRRSPAEEGDRLDR